MDMDWEQKFMALQCLAPTTLEIREPGSWWVNISVEIKDGPILKGVMGNGPTPQDAVEDLWDCITKLPAYQYIVVYTPLSKRKAFRWKTFLWEEVEEQPQ